MNGYQLLADNYRKLLNNSANTAQDAQEAIKRKIKALDIMANLDRQTQFELFNSGGFNGVCRGFLLMAMDNAGADHDTASRILSALDGLFETTGAEQAETYYMEH